MAKSSTMFPATFFFNTPLRSLPPWQLKKKTAMARRYISWRSSCLPLLLQHVAMSSFASPSTRPPWHAAASPSAMTVPRRVLVFAASSLQHAVASLCLPSAMAAPRRCVPFRNGKEEEECVPSVITLLRPLLPWQRRTLETLLELFADGHISVFPFTVTSSFHGWMAHNVFDAGLKRFMHEPVYILE
ncbi:hypothetical protein S83_060039 [Arachis hypogaea]